MKRAHIHTRARKNKYENQLLTLNRRYDSFDVRIDWNTFFYAPQKPLSKLSNQLLFDGIKRSRHSATSCRNASLYLSKCFFFLLLLPRVYTLQIFFLWYQQLSQQHDMETFLIKIIKIMSFIYPNNFSANGNYINLNLHAIIIYFQKQRALHFDE